MTQLPDQKEMWERKHTAGEHEHMRHQPSDFAILTEPLLPQYSRLLDLGCGTGRDAIYFARKGHTVIAADFSRTVIDQNHREFADEGVEFVVGDLRHPLKYGDHSFDAVFASLSLHYFLDADTRRIIGEVQKVIKDDGILAMSCKSEKDTHFGPGKEVEKNVFLSPSGHVRHFFTEKYMKEILQPYFDIEYLREVEKDYNREWSVIIQCIARKRNS